VTAIDLPAAPLPVEQLDARAVAAILDRAAALIERDGKALGEYWTCSLFASTWTDGRSCCAIGGIAVAAGIRDQHAVDVHVAGTPHYDAVSGTHVLEAPHPALAALAAHLHLTRPEDVMAWSDAATEAEVVAELRTCAAALRIAADHHDIDRLADGQLVTTDLATVLLAIGKHTGELTR
jgi:hypothetical protein